MFATPSKELVKPRAPPVTADHVKSVLLPAALPLMAAASASSGASCSAPTSIANASKVACTSGVHDSPQNRLGAKRTLSASLCANAAAPVAKTARSSSPWASTRLQDDYVVELTRLGSGSYSTVYKGRSRRTGEAVALKDITAKLTPRARKTLQKEAAIHKCLEHPNIVALFNAYQLHDHTVLVMEQLEGGNVFEYAAKKGVLDEISAANIIKQLLHALAYLHGLGIVHRDVKLENLAFADKSQKVVKLLDFGFAVYEDRMCKRICGTDETMSPEVFRGEGATTKSDMWAVGIETCTLLLGDEQPCTAKSAFGILQEFVSKLLGTSKATYHVPTHGLSASARDFATKLLVLEPKGRLSATEALAHPWIRQNAAAPQP